MRQMQPVLWTKGVLLAPQHLQTQDRYLHDLLSVQLSALSFCPWGFQHLELDQEAIEGGVVALSAAAGIFPDGLQFDIPASDAGPAPKSLEECWAPDQESLDVFLAIPEERVGGFNVSAGDGDRDTRYRAEVVLRRDENTGLAEKPIQVAKKNFRLLTGGESLEGAATLRVARVLRTPAGEYRFDAHFVPPLIDVSASEYLTAIVRRLVEILTAKSSELSGMRRQRNQGLADFGVSDIANFWLLYAVNTYLPQLRHVFETRRGHPEDLFVVLLSLAGTLTTFSSTVHPRDLPTYDHRDLAACFTDLDEKLRELLGTVVPRNYVSLAMQLQETSIYATAIDQDRLFAAVQWYVAIKADLPQDQFLKKAGLVKLGAADQMNRLIKQALPGVELRHVERPPSAIPVKLSYHYFLIERSGPEWDAIKRARSVAAYVPADFPEPGLEIVVVLPSD